MMMHIAATSLDKRILEIMAKEFAPAATAMAPGITGGVIVEHISSHELTE